MIIIIVILLLCVLLYVALKKPNIKNTYNTIKKPIKKIHKRYLYIPALKKYLNININGELVISDYKKTFLILNTDNKEYKLILDKKQGYLGYDADKFINMKDNYKLIFIKNKNIFNKLTFVKINKKIKNYIKIKFINNYFISYKNNKQKDIILSKSKFNNVKILLK